MNWIYGFFMAWGMFLAIPCPWKRWEERARGYMTACLPLVGIVVGAIWALAAYALVRFCVPLPLRALLLAALPWLLTGFLHLDGYMDVCDAVLSRRDLPERQRILKDSHCGAFSVICVALLLLAQWSVFLSVPTLPLLPLAAIPVVSRACAAVAVLSLRPMHTSQYASVRAVGVGCFVLPVLLGLAALLLPAAFCGISALAGLVACAVYWLAAFYGRRQLGGMSGDISGFALSLSELFGLLALCLLGG